MKKKSRIFIYPLIIMGLALVLTNSCKKKEEVPVLTTSAVSDITQTTATCGGLITSEGGAPITARGVCWSIGETPTIADSKTTNNPSVSFPSAITGLTAGTTYYVRAYATNSAGTGYGSVVSFTTQPVQEPVLTTSAVSDITRTTATCGGDITSDGGSAVTARGVCWSTGATPTTDNSKTTDGDGTGSFTSAITDLTAGTTYYVRAYATNSAGTAYGSAVSFLTQQPLGFPALTTSDVSYITQTTATCGGNITSDGGSAVTESGVCWSTGETPTIADSKTTDGTATGNFTSAITGLTANTTYYVRAYATNSAGTSYGTAMTFITLAEGVETVYDFDGNLYHTITIGTQVWMVENLKVTHYRNGDPITFVNDSTEWSVLTTEAYCNYNDDENNSITYGRLYNFPAVIDNRNIAPEGWHISTDEEWGTLKTFLGDAAIPKLKATTIWIPPYDGGTNESGFTAFPGGYRVDNGFFMLIEEFGLWWTPSGYYWMLYNEFGHDNIPVPNCGMSVRCVKN